MPPHTEHSLVATVTLGVEPVFLFVEFIPKEIVLVEIGYSLQELLLQSDHLTLLISFDPLFELKGTKFLPHLRGCWPHP
jgi:hypothetical protein